MSESPPFPLLELPDGVENLVVVFVSSGGGGLRAVLNLRAVCSTTRSWVDRLPPPQAAKVFSRGQVTMNSDLGSITRFLQYPPPFGARALSINCTALTRRVSSKEKKAWASFCAFWKPKLEGLQTRGDGNFRSQGYFFGKRLLELMESPRLQRLQLSNAIVMKRNSALPSSLKKIREFHVDVVYTEPSGNTQFYSQLEKNRNLRVLHANLHDEADLLGLTKFIDLHKQDTRLQVTFSLAGSDVIACSRISEQDPLFKLLASVLGSRSEIKVKVGQLREFDGFATALFPRCGRLELLSKVESALLWTPTGASLSLLESPPRLKELKYVIPQDSSLDFNQLTFPPSLEHLGFWEGFPAAASFPESLLSLKLSDYKCDGESLFGSLNLLSVRCPRLESLEIQWHLTEGKAPDLTLETPGGFRNLRKLKFVGWRVSREKVEEIRAALSNGFEWEQLRLHFLELSVKDEEKRQVPLLDLAMLQRLFEGPSARTLLTLELANESATLEGVRLLEELKSRASANWRRREETEGRGEWRKLYGKPTWPFGFNASVTSQTS